MSNSSVKYLLAAVNKLSPAINCRKKPAFVTIGFSHFCERARWVLDLSPLDYVEVAHSPALHLSSTLMELASYPRLNVLSKTGCDDDGHTTAITPQQRKSLDRKELTSVPKLVLDSSHIDESYRSFLELNSKQGSRMIFESSLYTGPVIIKDGSSGIMRYIADKYPNEMHFLYPSRHKQNIIDAEQYIVSELALEVTKWLFGNVLLTGKAFDPNCPEGTNAPTRKKFLQICNNSSIPTVERVVLTIFGQNMIVPLMIKNNDVSIASRIASQQKIIAALDKLEQRQNGNGKYLFQTDKLSAADITLASLLYPAIVPPQCSKYFCTLTDLESLEAPGAQNIVNFANLLKNKYKIVRNALELYNKER